MDGRYVVCRPIYVFNARDKWSSISFWDSVLKFFFYSNNELINQWLTSISLVIRAKEGHIWTKTAFLTMTQCVVC